jgi:hypothetical protein
MRLPRYGDIPQLEPDQVRDLAKQASILRAAIKILEDVSLPYGYANDKRQLEMDGSLAQLQLLAHDMSDAVVANLTPELEEEL